VKNQIATKLYCQSCGTRLVWRAAAADGVEVNLEPDGTVRGLTLHAVCAGCRSTYRAWLNVANAPLWWEETRADTSRSCHKHESLTNYQQASAKRRRVKTG
jgi:hypothetical protein